MNREAEAYMGGVQCNEAGSSARILKHFHVSLLFQKVLFKLTRVFQVFIKALEAKR